MGFQLCCELHPISSMRSPHHKSNYTICTARSSLFNLHQLQPSATSGPNWQRSHFQGNRRMVKIYYTLKPIIFQCASRLCIRNVIYIAGVSSISNPYHAHNMCTPSMWLIQRDKLTTCCILSFPAVLKAITAFDSEV